MHCTEPKSYKEIINQFLLYNKALKINKKCILPGLFKGEDLSNITPCFHWSFPAWITHDLANLGNLANGRNRMKS